MVHQGGGEKIIIKKEHDGHYVYFSVIQDVLDQLPRTYSPELYRRLMWCTSTSTRHTWVRGRAFMRGIEVRINVGYQPKAMGLV